VGQVTGVERPDVLLARQPALPRLRSLRPASRVARLADSLLRPIARSLRLPSSNGAGPSSRLSTVSADLLRLLIGGLPLKLLAVEALLEIFVGITAEFRESGMCL
jgi:hypothetical protein